MRAASPLAVGLLATGDAAIRRAADTPRLCTRIDLDSIDSDDVLEARISLAMTDADLVAAVDELGLAEVVEAKARDIVAERLRQGEPA